MSPREYVRERSEEYWAAVDDEQKLAASCIDRVKDFRDRMRTSRQWSSARRNWYYYHNIYFKNQNDYSDTSIRVMGRDGQLRAISLNHFRELMSHILNIATENKPDYQAEAVNDDNESLTKARLGDQIVGDYLWEKKLGKKIVRATEEALILQQGFFSMLWNPNIGSVIERISEEDDEEEPEEDSQPVETLIREGDFDCRNPTIFDVVWDYSNPDWDRLQWVIIRTLDNRWDLAAKARDEETLERIKGLELHDDSDERPDLKFDVFDFDNQYSDLVSTYHFIHLETDGCPGGRYFRFGDNNTALSEILKCPYDRLPLFRIVPEEQLLTSFGYSRANDLQAVQEAINSEMSTILTNHAACGIQVIWKPDGAELDENMIGKGILIVSGGQVPPTGVNLSKTPREFYEFHKNLTKAMEMISGVNQVARGQPEANLRTGEALKVLDSKAVQAASPLLKSYFESIEDSGTFTLNHLPRFIKDQKRIIRVVGESERGHVMKFTAAEIEGVGRVRVQAGNALQRTIAGKLAIADRLLDRGFIRTPQHYIEVMTTGRYEPLVRGEQAELELIRAENKALLDGAEVTPMATDNHVLHIREHQAAINSPDVREDPERSSKMLTHILMHITELAQPGTVLLQSALGFEIPPILAATGGVQPPQEGGAEAPVGDGGEFPPSPPGDRMVDPDIQSTEAAPSAA